MAMRATSLSRDTSTGINRDIGSQYDNVKTVAENLDAISTAITNIGTMEDIMANISIITSVGSNIANVIQVAEAAADINAVSALSTEIQSLYADRVILSSLYADKITLDGLYNSKAAIDSLYTDKAVLDSLFADKVTLDSLFTDKATLDSLYADKAILDSLYADKTILDRLHTSINNIDRIYTSIDNLDTVHASIANVDITAGISGDVTTVAGDSADVQLLADHIDGTVSTDISLVADHIDGTLSTDITTVATSIASVNAVGTDIANVNTTAGSIANVNTVATNIADVNSVVTNLAEILNVDTLAAQVTADRTAIETIYDNFDDRYLGAFAADPTLDNDGSALLIGAIYFNTTDNETKFYNGAAWESPEATATQAAATATTKASEASTSASNAATSEGNALISANNAATSESNASTSESNASASASAASTSATNASTSESNAATSATNAATSETNAATSATNASNSASAAASAQTAAELALDEFTNLYLGAKSTDPTVDNDGNPLQTGAIYYDTTISSLKLYNGSTWIEAVFDASGAVTSFNTRQGNVTLSNTDVTGATGQALDVTGTPTFVSTKLSGGTNNQGTLSWNNVDETLDLVVNDNVTYQLGEELGIGVRNLSGTAIANGTIVRITGASGDKVTIDVADNTSELTSSSTIAVATEAISNNSTGKVTTNGLVRGLDTSTFTEGAAVWLGTNGQFIETKPDSPAHLVLIGWVVRVHTTEGMILTHVSNGWEIEELHDVLITSATEGDLLVWEASTGLWKNKAQSNLSITESQISDFGSYQPLTSVLTNTTASYTTAEETKLSGIEAGATGDQTASEILTAIKTVDGSGSGLDADTLDGRQAVEFQNLDTIEW